MRKANKEKWNNKTTAWVPLNMKRKRGSLAIKWLDKIIVAVGTNWLSAA